MTASAPGVPMLVEIARPRALDLLAFEPAGPVRILCAPHGGGKTTLLHQFAALHDDVRIVSLPARASRAQVVAALERYPDARVTIVDRADEAAPSGDEALFERIETRGADGTNYLLCGASRTRMHAPSLLARGKAVMVDASALRFTAPEIVELARAQGVTAGITVAERLRVETDGWPIAVAWILRDAARDGSTLDATLDVWRERNGHFALEFIRETYEAEATDAFIGAIRSLPLPSSQRILERLEAEGYPLVRTLTGMRPYPVLVHAADAISLPDAGSFPDECLTLNLFGRFSCSIAGRPVVFERRRDRSILAYVALAPSASVTRDELLGAFWANAPRSAALQGLRTTLSRLRRALAAAAGSSAARYLRVDRSVSLDVEWVAIDVRAFRADIALADAEDAVGNRSVARELYLRAERRYRGALLASEAPEPSLIAHVVASGALMQRVLAWLDHLPPANARAGRRDAAVR